METGPKIHWDVSSGGLYPVLDMTVQVNRAGFDLLLSSTYLLPASSKPTYDSLLWSGGQFHTLNTPALKIQAFTSRVQLDCIELSSQCFFFLFRHTPEV